MNDDRTLLELAAKAGGIKGEWVRDAAFVQERYYFNVPYDNQNMLTGFAWDPLTDDGDALRLAVKLGMDVCIEPENVGVFANYESETAVEEPTGNDPCAATRRAIVRAAALIGKAI